MVGLREHYLKKYKDIKDIEVLEGFKLYTQWELDNLKEQVERKEIEVQIFNELIISKIPKRKMSFIWNLKDFLKTKEHKGG